MLPTTLPCGFLRFVFLSLVLLAFSPSNEAAICEGVSDINNHVETFHDLDQDGFPDLKIVLDHSQTSKYLPDTQECMIQGGRAVILVPLGQAKLLSQSTFTGPSPVVLSKGQVLGPNNSTGWASFPATAYLAKISGPLSKPFEIISGPLTPALGPDAYFAMRLPGPDGDIYSWIQIASGSSGTILSMAAQREPTIPIKVGEQPSPPDPSNNTSYISIDATGDNAPDLFVVRTKRTDALSASRSLQRDVAPGSLPSISNGNGRWIQTRLAPS